ncbi:TatD family hydrolase [Streptomyces collinus]|uniref:Hydrolase n=1 Tax=Streptomyces collinus (strain DSM 40733 / Tue 365) TaxID=1214242 RepID=S5VAK6_STRC3|nr:hypothetical protein B446_03600 [Streptomyces collinus Tu 365]UJA06232.1 TatD family hydrolase [Streptomyces collinus]UJA12598.1 TatD family hydrolase [Streptomyces collinus]
MGEIGYDSMIPAEDTVLAAPLQLAADHGLPALVHTPHRDKLAGLRRTLDAVRESAQSAERVLVDHLNETTVAEARSWSTPPPTGAAATRPRPAGWPT